MQKGSSLGQLNQMEDPAHRCVLCRYRMVQLLAIVNLNFGECYSGLPVKDTRGEGATTLNRKGI